MKHFATKMHVVTAFFIWVLISSFAAFGTEYTVDSDSEFNNLTLVAGDVVTWSNGTYSDQDIRWDGQVGTAENPIILKAETPGGVIFTGESQIYFFGTYLIVDGFYWKGGDGASNHIEFRRSGSNTDFGINCTLRNCAFDNLVTSETDKSRWIVLYGENNVIENCSFVNKLSAGALILVELANNGSLTPGHIIRKNYFYNITPKDTWSTNSGDSEAIRIGVSSDQAVSAQVLVEGNYFKEVDGENEIITNKSTDNIFLHNTFRKCRGSLVMRHGAGAHIEGNFFLGEGKAKSGGIRISDRDHVIINNYMQGLSNGNDIWNNGITLVGGGASSGGSSSGYQNVDNVIIAHNTIYASDDPIFFNDRSSYDPTGIIAYNLIYSENGDIVSGDISGTGQGMTYEGNIFGGSAIGITDNGIVDGNADFSASGEIFKPSSTGIAANAAGSVYSNEVNIDVEGVTRPNTDLDVGAHEVSGGIGSMVYSPITDDDVGSGVGACFIGADGNVLPACGAVGDYLTVSPVTDFTDAGGTKTTSISSNVDWTVTDDQDWISVSPTSGSGVGSIDITVTTNSTTSERIGIVTVTGTGLDARVIGVTQEPYVPPIDVTGVSLSPASVTLGVGETQTLTPIVSPSDASNQGVSYSSDNSSIASVDASGVVTAESVGTTTITVTTDDGNLIDRSNIVVLAASTGTNVALLRPITGTGTADGENTPDNLVDGDLDSRWAVTGFPQSATVDLHNTYSIDAIELVCYNDRAYQYIVEVSTDRSSYTTIVDRSGNTTPGSNAAPITNTFLALDARYVRITVSGAAEYTGSWMSLEELIVRGDETNNPVSVSGVSLSPESISLLESATEQLTTEVVPVYATDQGVSYSSDNTSSATVDMSGLVTGISAGTAIITVTTDDGNLTSTTNVTVSPMLSVTGVSISPVTVTLDVGNTQQLSADVSPTSASDQGVTYSSNTIAIATVNASGLVTGISAGTAIITVTTDDGNFSATSDITVSSPVLNVDFAEVENDVWFGPNPAFCEVKFGGVRNHHTLKIFDQIGRVILEQEIDGISSIDVSMLKRGIYIFKLIGNNQTHVQRIFKQ